MNDTPLLAFTLMDTSKVADRSQCRTSAVRGTVQYLFPSLKRQTYLHHHYVLGALVLDFGVLDLYSHDPPVMQHCLVDLS